MQQPAVAMAPRGRRRAVRRGLLAAGAAAALLHAPGGADAFTTSLSGPSNALIAPGTPGSALLELQPWLTNYDPDAVCGDGTPAGYYYRASDTGSNIWVVYLEGGYWCWDAESCNERYQSGKFSMSSSGWASSMAQMGMLGTAPDNPFANTHKIFVKYCSSDSWFGDAGASAATFNFNFRGARIVSAVMSAMIQAHGLGAGGAEDQVLLSGCSAGGRGVLTNLDHFAQQAPSNVEVKGFMDAALWVDVEPPMSGMLSLMDMTKDLWGFTAPYTDGRVPADCLAQYQGEDAWQCVWPSTRLPFVKTPYFVNAAQFDAFQIMYDTENLDSEYCCTTAAQEQYVEQFQTATLQALNQVPNSMGVFSSTCLVHCLSGAGEFTTFTVNGQTLAADLANWYFNGKQVTDISQCQGWDCTEQCSGGPWKPSNTPCTSSTNVCVHDYMQEGGAPAPEEGKAVWTEAQVASHIAATQAAGNAAWSVEQAQQKQAAAQQQGQPPMSASEEKEQANQEWAEQQAASKHAAAIAAGNAAWAVQEANAKQAGGSAAWALTHQPPAHPGQQPQQQQQQQQGGGGGNQWQGQPGQGPSAAHGPNPYAKPANPVPLAQAQQAGNQAWSQQAGNIAWEHAQALQNQQNSLSSYAQGDGVPGQVQQNGAMAPGQQAAMNEMLLTMQLQQQQNQQAQQQARHAPPDSHARRSQLLTTQPPPQNNNNNNQGNQGNQGNNQNNNNNNQGRR